MKKTKLKYRRILLKLSGEVLADKSKGECIAPSRLDFMAEREYKFEFTMLDAEGQPVKVTKKATFVE